MRPKRPVRAAPRAAASAAATSASADIAARNDGDSTPGAPPESNPPQAGQRNGRYWTQRESVQLSTRRATRVNVYDRGHRDPGDGDAGSDETPSGVGFQHGQSRRADPQGSPTRSRGLRGAAWATSTTATAMFSLAPGSRQRLYGGARVEGHAAVVPHGIGARHLAADATTPAPACWCLTRRPQPTTLHWIGVQGYPAAAEVAQAHGECGT